jgi:hypothetical protein
MRGKPGIISVGNRHEWPRSLWGWKDWQAEEQAQRWAQPADPAPVVPEPLHTIAPGFGLYRTPSRPRGRGREVDRLLEKLGVQPRRRAR